jgi:uncharacterized protein (DUF2141 family)
MHAAPIAVLAGLMTVASSAAEPGPAPASVSLDISVTGIRSDSGVIRLAICAPDTGFPDCKTKAARTADLSIEKGVATVSLANLAPGTYAVSVFHDANGNGKLDTFLGIPREGYGFSRNPPFRPRAPRFSETVISLTSSASERISLRYLF